MRILPHRCRIVLLADRVHTGEPLLSCLDELQWYFVFRASESTLIEHPTKGWMPLKRVYKRANIRRFLRGVRIWKQGERRITVSICKLVRKGFRPTMWYIVSDLPASAERLFEDEYGKADYVSTRELQNLLPTSHVRFAFLSACRSAMVRGETLFGGIAPGLIDAAIPAVIAMQMPILLQDAVTFTKGFYSALAQGESLPKAVAHGCRKLFRGKSWYIPTLYLRSIGDEDRLFEQV